MIFGLGGGKNVICGTRWVKQSLSDSQNQEEESSSLLRDVFNRKKKGTGDEQINLALKHLFSAYRRKRRLKLPGQCNSALQLLSDITKPSFPSSPPSSDMPISSEKHEKYILFFGFPFTLGQSHLGWQLVIINKKMANIFIDVCCMLAIRFWVSKYLSH